MGVGTGTGVAKKVLVKRVACGVMAGIFVAGLGACSPKVANNVTLQKALDDFRAGSTALAKSEFEQVVKEDPNNKYAWYNLGVLAQYAGDTSSSAKNYQKALDIDPRFESALYNYGVLKFSGNDLPSAITYLEKAIAENNQDANAHWNLGLALAKQGSDSKRSTKELNAAIKLNPDLPKSLTGAPLKTGTTVGPNTNPTSPSAGSTTTTAK
jgi:Tfp pilus assembly protein PilF